jgi:hypothetical protein
VIDSLLKAFIAVDLQPFGCLDCRDPVQPLVAAMPPVVSKASHRSCGESKTPMHHPALRHRRLAASRLPIFTMADGLEAQVLPTCPRLG